MTNKELTSLAIKVFAIYLLLEIVIFIGNVGPQYLYDEELANKSWLAVTVSALIILIVAFLALWRLANGIIKTVKPSNQPVEKYKVDQVFILHLIGLYLLAVGLIDVIQTSSLLYTLSADTNLVVSHTDKVNVFFDFFVSICQLIIGISLVFKPITWTKMLYKVRNLGH